MDEEEVGENTERTSWRGRHSVDFVVNLLSKVSHDDSKFPCENSLQLYFACIYVNIYLCLNICEKSVCLEIDFQGNEQSSMWKAKYMSRINFPSSPTFQYVKKQFMSIMRFWIESIQ